jgi:8-oxo-dGTP pyrophosphatase MutT (NUDIX family)
MAQSILQSGVIPYWRVERQWRVLLVSSRRGRRWVAPKGAIERGMTPWESAAKEALEEAGVRGRVAPKSLGEYQYRKFGDLFVVQMYPLLVTEVLDKWDEDFRQRLWLPPDEASKQIEEPELGAMILALHQQLTPPRKLVAPHPKRAKPAARANGRR